MARVRDILYRFRPSGAPGSPSRAGVPVDRARGLAEELAPVFAALAPTLAECADIEAAGRRQAQAARTARTGETQRLRAAIPQRAAAERARSTALAHAAAAPDLSAIDTATRERIDLLCGRAREALPALGREVADSVEQLLEDLG